MWQFSLWDVPYSCNPKRQIDVCGGKKQVSRVMKCNLTPIILVETLQLSYPSMLLLINVHGCL
jgi:hypothetical protein